MVLPMAALKQPKFIPVANNLALEEIAYGIARATKDADFVIQTTEEKRLVLLRSLPPDFVIDDQITFETVTGHRRQILKLPKIPYVIELFDLSGEPFDRERFARRKATVLAGRPAWLPSPEDVVVQKLRWASLAKRPQDLIDATNVIQVSGEFLNWPYIEEWCSRLVPPACSPRRVPWRTAENGCLEIAWGEGARKVSDFHPSPTSPAIPALSLSAKRSSVSACSAFITATSLTWRHCCC